jgi:hypothetical protein
MAKYQKKRSNRIADRESQLTETKFTQTKIMMKIDYKDRDFANKGSG